MLAVVRGRCLPFQRRAVTGVAVPLPNSCLGLDRNTLADWEVRVRRAFPAIQVVARTSQDSSNDRVTVLFGVEHDSDEAAEQVAAAIMSLKPQQVGLELCPRRMRKLFPLGVERFAQLSEKEQLELRARLSHGKDQLAAAVAAHCCSIPYELCDRSICVTEARFLHNMSLRALCAASATSLGVPLPNTFIAWLAVSCQLMLKCRTPWWNERLLGLREPGIVAGTLSEALLDDLSKKATMLASDEQLSPRERARQMLAIVEEAALVHKPSDSVDEVATAAQTCLINERDVVLSSRLLQLPGPLVVGVVGAAHVDGVARLLDAPVSNLSDLDARLCMSSPLRWRRLVGQPLLWRLRGSI